MKKKAACGFGSLIIWLFATSLSFGFVLIFVVGDRSKERIPIKEPVPVPESGESFWYLLTTLSLVLLIQALRRFK